MDRPRTNKDKIHLVETHFIEILKILGIDETENTAGTPLRISKMLVNEVCKNIDPASLQHLKNQMKYFPNETQPYKNMVMVKKIAYNSWCVHHFLPFSGYMNIGYVPDEKVLGLSKFPRVVEHFSKMPQLQEYLVVDICDFIFDVTKAGYVMASSVAVHACVACRGIENACETVAYFDRHKNRDADYHAMFNNLGGFNFE